MLLLLLISFFSIISAYFSMNHVPISNQIPVQLYNKKLIADSAVKVGLFSGLFSTNNNDNRNSDSVSGNSGNGGINNNGNSNKFYGPTNQVVKTVDGIRWRRLGNSDIIVSEMGLGTQRWVSDDFNAPNEDLCMQFMVRNKLLQH